MGRKSSAKANTPPSSTPTTSRRSPLLFVVGLVVVALVAGGAVYMRNGSSDGQVAAANDTFVSQRTPIPADLKAHPQEHLPPLQFPAYQMQRPAEVVTAAYKFAAEHPEVLSYVPCFCGCEHSGHRGNEDCFVKARDVNGDVVQWEDHGMECAVCLDVATRARQLYNSGASVAAIRAAVEKEWAAKATNHTPTPDPPHH